jgi:hypothetical protein
MIVIDARSYDKQIISEKAKKRYYYINFNTFRLFGFQYFDFECTWWRLIKKRVVCTELDIYVFILYYLVEDLPFPSSTNVFLIVEAIYQTKFHTQIFVANIKRFNKWYTCFF